MKFFSENMTGLPLEPFTFKTLSSEAVLALVKHNDHFCLQKKHQMLKFGNQKLIQIIRDLLICCVDYVNAISELEKGVHDFEVERKKILDYSYTFTGVFDAFHGFPKLKAFMELNNKMRAFKTKKEAEITMRQISLTFMVDELKEWYTFVSNLCTSLNTTIVEHISDSYNANLVKAFESNLTDKFVIRFIKGFLTQQTFELIAPDTVQQCIDTFESTQTHACHPKF